MEFIFGVGVKGANNLHFSPGPPSDLAHAHALAPDSMQYATWVRLADFAFTVSLYPWFLGCSKFSLRWTALECASR